MQITETTKRECCQEQDMVPYRGRAPNAQVMPSQKPAFCKRCGQLWLTEGYLDEAGGQDFRRIRWGG